MDGTYDSAAVAVSGLYTDADVGAWIAAAGYPGDQITQAGHLPHINGQVSWRVASDTAVFVVRDIDRSVGVSLKLTHMGLPLKEFT
jgi:hypothetical protein